MEYQNGTHTLGRDFFLYGYAAYEVIAWCHFVV